MTLALTLGITKGTPSPVSRRTAESVGPLDLGARSPLRRDRSADARFILKPQPGAIGMLFRMSRSPPFLKRSCASAIPRRVARARLLAGKSHPP